MSIFFEATLESKKKVAKNTYELSFRVPDDFTFKPGQYIWLVLPELKYEDPKGDRRAFNITSSPEQKGRISIIFRASDSGFKKTILELSQGSVFKMRGPYGSVFTIDESVGGELCFIGGGVGIAPCLSILRAYNTLAYRPKITLINLQMNEEKTFLQEELQYLAQNPNITIVNQLGRFSTKMLLNVKKFQEATYFISGTQERIDEIYNQLTSIQVPQSKMRFEQYYPSTPSDIKLLLSGDEEKTHGQKNIRQKFISRLFTYYIVSANIFAFGLGMHYLLGGSPPSETYFLFLAVFLLTVSFLVSRIEKYFWIALHATLAVTLFLIIWALEQGFLDGFAVFWIYFFPSLSYFFLGKKGGSIWTTIYLLLLCGVYVFSFAHLTPYFYPSSVIFLSLASVLYICILSYLVNSVSEKFEEMLQKTISLESKFRLAVESSTNHIIITDPNGEIVYANKAAEKTSGYTISEMLGQTPRLWGGLMPPEFYRKLWKEKKEEKQAFHGEIINVRKNGEIYTALSNISPIFDDNKKIIGYIGTEEDVSERIRLEKDLRKQNESIAREKQRDDAILTNIGDGVVAVDTEGRIISANTAAQNMLGFSQEEMLDKILVELIPAKDIKGNPIPLEKRPMTQALMSNTRISATLIYPRKGDGDFTASIIDNPLIIDGRPFGNVTLFRDVTKEQEIDRAKTEFISLASHQLRTPLSTINWYCELLLSGDAGEINEKQRQFLEEAYQGSQRMSKLVKALLNVSRIETGTFVVEPEKVDVIKLVRQVLDESKPQIDQRKLTVKLEKEEIPVMLLDPNLTTMIFQNLITNSAKYTPEGGAIKITLKVIQAGGSVADHKVAYNSLLIQVTDNGMGIPKGQQNQIFKKLFRADNVRKEDTQGTGLGLYMIKSLIEHSNGKIWFESQVGKGTTFYVLLPLSGMQKKEGTKKLNE